MSIKSLAKKIVYGEKSSSEAYVSYLRSLGVSIGEDCIIYGPKDTFIDEQYPWLITIGDHVRITTGCKILTHDYSWSVIKLNEGNDIEGAILGACGTIVIGNNVFIGMNSVITRNVKIGDNVIIGTGSIVTKDCESNSVYAGSPAKKIMTLDEFIEKRISSQIKEARLLAIEYKKRFGAMPPQEVFHEYFMLFINSNNVKNISSFNEKMKLGGNYQVSLEYLENHKPPFDSYIDFMRYCFPDEDKGM